jgi:hypothetical protein
VESGPVKDREGAQVKKLDREKRYLATQEDLVLHLEGLGDFIKTADFVAGLDLATRDGRGCLLRFVQLSVRTAQARIRNFGGGGTVIYSDNESTFAGFLNGELSIVMENLLSPDTTIGYENFQDFPELAFDGSFISHVNTSGDGTLDRSVNVTIYSASAQAQMSDAGGGNAGASGEDAPLARGKLVYGPDDPIEIDQGDVVGGSYDWVLCFPEATSDNFSWGFLQDLDLRACDARF